MEIRELPPEMIEDAVVLWEAAGLTRPWNDPSADVRRALDGHAPTILAGFHQGDLIATVIVGHDGHRGWVYYLAVHPEARGQGCGRTMMAAAESWLIARRVPKLNLMVRSDNNTARSFYQALGYGRDDVIVLSRRLLPRRLQRRDREPASRRRTQLRLTNTTPAFNYASHTQLR